MNSWELIFLQSKVNNNGYSGEHLATQNWAWPQETWFQKRLDLLRMKRRQTAAELRLKSTLWNFHSQPEAELKEAEERNYNSQPGGAQ